MRLAKYLDAYQLASVTSYSINAPVDILHTEETDEAGRYLRTPTTVQDIIMDALAEPIGVWRPVEHGGIAQAIEAAEPTYEEYLRRFENHPRLCVVMEAHEGAVTVRLIRREADGGEW